MKPTCIAVVSAKGGVGKTTTAVNLADWLVASTSRGQVLVIDLDPQGHATIGLDVERDSGRRQFSDALKAAGKGSGSSVPLHDVCVDTRVERLSIIPSDPLLESSISAPDTLSRMLAPYVDQIAYCVIDTPPNLGLLTTNAIHAMGTFPVGTVLSPIQQARFSIEGLAQLLDALEAIAEQNPGVDPENFHVLLTMVDGRVKRARAYAERELAGLSAHVLESTVGRCEAVNDAQSYGKTVFFHAPRSRAVKDYSALAKELLAKLKKGRGRNGID